MILAPLSDGTLRGTVLRSARPDEDVFVAEAEVLDALERGFPRILVHGEAPEDGPGMFEALRPDVPRLLLTRSLHEAWDRERLAHEVPPPRAAYLAGRLREAMEERSRPAGWVEAVLRDLGLAAGSALPEVLVGLGRRVLEHPAHYTTLGALAEATGLSAGSLKGRFRRRGLASPFTYMRWFRVVAVVEGLTTQELPYREGAYRLGFSGSGNMSRFVEGTTGLSAGQLTASGGRARLLAAFASRLLSRDAVRGLEGLEDVFRRGAA
ncbi:MAG TPA: helix-turn-helix domain-containing protein [Longimicrobiales bacterium]|nr:helix-turn-helix domain-containing protein [Longimicrobiales bacterium]